MNSNPTLIEGLLVATCHSPNRSTFANHQHKNLPIAAHTKLIVKNNTRYAEKKQYVSLSGPMAATLE
jgi:hypothetical protein